MGIIIITGTPCTGKTTIAKKISSLKNYDYLDVNKLIKQHKVYEKYDRKTKSYLADTKKVKQLLLKIIKKSKNNLVIDSHLSHYLPSKLVDLCILTKCDIKILKKRLKKRKYNEQKIRENLDAEILDICLNEAVEHKHRIMVIDTTKKVNYNNILKKIH